MKPANKEKLTALISADKSNTAERNKARIKNREMLRESRAIAMKIHDRLEELGWTKKLLADKLEVAPQQVTKYLSGKENITLKTIVELQRVLKISILSSYEPIEVEQNVTVTIKLDKQIIIPVSGISANYEACLQVPKRRARSYSAARKQSFDLTQTEA